MMCLLLVLGMVPVHALAETGSSAKSGLCEHHTEHTAECGYVPAQEEIPCNMGCVDAGGEGVVEHVIGCAYTPAREGRPCGYVCEICGDETGSQQDTVTQTSGAGNGTEITGTDTNGEDNQLQGGSSSSGADQEEQAVADVQMLIDALPSLESLQAMTTEEQQAAYAQVQAAQEAYAALTGEQQVRISGAEVLDSLSAWFNSLPVPETAGVSADLSGHTIDSVSPAHVTFNLFDYWVNTQDSAYSIGWESQKGINQGHPLIFGDGDIYYGDWNAWTGHEGHINNRDEDSIRYGVYTGIVAPLLQDGFPQLALGDETTGVNFINSNNLRDKLDESLAYLFDPDVSNDYKAVYENVQGLVKYDNNGGYIYDSHENYAAFQPSAAGTLGTNGEPSAGYFDVYDSWGLTSGGSPNGQFFPFDGADEVFEIDSNGNYEVDSDGKLIPRTDVLLDTDQTTLNHFLGLTMETVFLQPANGRIDASTPMSFTFSGDDDVWIFIDGVLVSDEGGIHDECFTVIDFEYGVVYTGLTPMVKNPDGTYSGDMPTLEELRSEENGTSTQTVWTWFDRADKNQTENTTGSYQEFKEAHGIKTTTLRELFRAAGQEDIQSWGDGNTMSEYTFDQNTQHDLKMFYLERGAGASNLVLGFNMLAVPASGITKTDQDGNPVSGATFELWPAQVSGTEKDEYGFAAPVLGEDGLYVADESSGTPICTATTDESGKLNFIAENQKIISFQERAQSDNPQLYYVLKETEVPPGYRSKGNISLYYSIYNKDSMEGVLLSHKYWQTGAYTQAKLDVTMTEDLYQYTVQDGQAVAGEPLVPEGQDAMEYLDNGIIFAVPIKRIDMERPLYEEDNFCALYGTANTGWTMMHDTISDKESVLEAARNMVRVMQESHQSGTIIAERNAEHLFHMEVSNIPGDVKLSYPYLQPMGKGDDAQYNIAFYFAPNADSLDDITDPDTIVRIAASDRSGNTFERQYASQFYVPNILNRVRVQKLDYQGVRLKDAEFTMYQAYSTRQRDDNYVLVGENSEDTGHIGLYRNSAVVNENGTLKDRNAILSTTYWDRAKTSSEGADGTGGLDLDGALLFPSAFNTYVYSDQTGEYKVNPADTSTYMEEGEYIIYETAAPAGYEVNETPITVKVNDDGVFADAGQTDDGVRAGQYAGWILNSLCQFAAEDPVDETLTFVKTNLKIMGEDGLQSPIEGDMTWQNKYSNQNHRYITLAEDVGRYITAGRNLYQYTDEGMPRLVIRQNQDVTAKVIVLLETDATNNNAHYSGPVTVNKKNADGTIYSLDGWATNGTLAFWLQKDGTEGGAQTLDSVVINGKTLELDNDYRVYTPNVTDLSEYNDLSGLFAVETLVQVFDQGYGSLSVTKKTENISDSSALKNEIFRFRIYSSYENATKVVLAKTRNGETVLDPETGQPEIVDFTGTLNVRLRQEAYEGQATQDTATNIAVDFVKGEGMFYLQPDYDVEYVFIPENRDHPAYAGLQDEEGLVGLVETQITLSDAGQSGQAAATAEHVAFTDRIHTYNVTFTDGEGTLYRNPDYTITQLSFGSDGPVYTLDGTSTFTADNRFQYASPDRILDVPVQGEVDVTFTEENGDASSGDRVVTSARPQGNDTIDDDDVTVYQDGNGYKLAYSLSSNTAEHAVVAQFALHSGQTINVDPLPVGAVYYVYEYAVGENGSREDLEDWDTDITWDNTEEGTCQRIEGYRAVRGTIALGDTAQTAGSVIFTNTARVGRLTISKTVAGDQANDTDRNQSFTFTVTLKNEDGTPLQGTYSCTGTAIDGVTAPTDDSLELDANGQATVTLAHGQSITIEDIPDGVTYEVTEGKSGGFTVVVDDDTDADQIAEGAVTIGQTANAHFTNVKQSDLNFTKVAAENTDQPLEGAEFMLFRLICTDAGHDHTELIDPDDPGSCWQKEGNTQTSSGTGAVSFGALLHSSEYRLVETKAPDGYALPEGQWKITTDADNAIEIVAVGGQDGRLPTAFAVDGGGKLLLPNARPMDIPSSGGWGMRPFLIIGGLLMLAAAGILIGRNLYRKYSISKK